MRDNKVTYEQVNEIFSKAEKTIETYYEKCTVVVCKLANGFVIVESSSCIDPQNYNMYLGARICEKRIKNKVATQMSRPKKGVYRHFKGNLYEVLGTAQHTERDKEKYPEAEQRERFKMVTE